jgi:DNA-directed RNA polymerase subunit RPC12/RpoP
VVIGHLVTVNEIRGEWTEYVCLRCGHPFCFRLTGQPESDQEHQLHV